MRLLTYLVIFLFLFPTSVNASDDLGIPCSEQGFLGRNLWDMIVYHDQLYVGCGDYTHNTGPINVWTFTDDAGWKTEFTVDEEEISHFRILDDTLIIPGADAREGWDFGNWYERTPAGEWTKHRNIPNALHVWDIFDYQGLRFAAIGAEPEGEAVAISTDKGLTWTTQVVPLGSPVRSYTSCDESYVGRSQIIGMFFTVGGQLYADLTGIPNIICRNGVPEVHGGFRTAHWDGVGFQPVPQDLFPGLRHRICCMMVTAVAFGNDTFYVAQTQSEYGLYRIDQTLNTQQLHFAECSRPQDLELSEGVVYVLCNEPHGEDWRISVSATCDSEHWNEVFSVTASTFARSFVIWGNLVYWSLGSDWDAIVSAQAATGRVYREQVQAPTTCQRN